MKLAFSTNAFKRYSLIDAIKAIAEIGYEGVEILCDVPHAYPACFSEAEAIDVKHTLSNRGIQISNLNAFTLYALGDVYHPSWIEADPVQRDQRIKHTIDCIHLAKNLEAKHLSTEPGGPRSPAQDDFAFEKMFLSGLEKVTKLAEEKDVKILIEPEPGLLIENSHHFRKFIKQVGSDCIRLNFDIGHFYCVHEDPASLVFDLADYIEHFHLADIRNYVHNHLIPGRGEIDFGPVFEAMNEIGYDGFVTVELYPYHENPIVAASEAYSYLCSTIEQIR
jgi:sugar phosphate isomerase/epimerase